MKLKTMLVLTCAAAALAVAGCGVVREAGNDVSRKIDQGLPSQGRLVSPNQTSDSFGPDYN